MSLHNEVRVATDVALFGSTIFSMIVTIYVTINLLQTEIDCRTIYTILSKPVRRWQFLVGKFAGIAVLMAVILAVLFTAAAGVITFQGGDLSVALVWAFAAIYCQLLILAALTLLLASYSSPLLAGLLAASLFLTGHLHDRLESVGAYFENPAVQTIVDILEVIVPDLSSLNLATEVVHSIPISPSYLLAAAWYTVSYAGLAMLGAIVVFAHRDLD
jgi:ABC-type transport system involved in multi-copper enzyme maturation permease subunit